MVKKIKAFFYIAYKSIVSPKYYLEIFKTKFDFSIKYYAVLVLIAATITSAGTYLIEGPRARQYVDKTLNELEKSFPEDLVFTIKGGEWEVNKPLPLIFELPKTEMENTIRPEQETMPKNLVVLDKNGTVADIKNYDTMILVNEKNILVRKAGEPDVLPLKDMPDTTLDKSKILAATRNARVLAAWMIPLAIILFTFSGAVVYYAVFRGIYIAIVGGLIFGISRLMKVAVDFKKALRIGLHAMTLPILMDVVLGFLNLVAVVPFWFMFVNLLIAFLVLLEIKRDIKKKTEPSPESPQSLIEPPKTM
ncbi:MAG: hypothetical protein KatS3mg101_0099 [Patescibacteria group bacterium]|nr:MAG: hypothetical protein KatS3mg101_0099 [Patescibacteria group bacterium]